MRARAITRWFGRDWALPGPTVATPLETGSERETPHSSNTSGEELEHRGRFADVVAGLGPITVAATGTLSDAPAPARLSPLPALPPARQTAQPHPLPARPPVGEAHKLNTLLRRLPHSWPTRLFDLPFIVPGCRVSLQGPWGCHQGGETNTTNNYHHFSRC